MVKMSSIKDIQIANKGAAEKRQNWRPKVKPKATASLSCPFCQSPIEPFFAICPHCGRSLNPEKCSFCGASMSVTARFCTHCGQPREGITCPQCGTLNSRNFCRKCNSPLTPMAQIEQERAKNDPKFKIVQAKAKELAELHRQIEQLRKGRKQEESVHHLSEEDKKMVDEYAQLLQSMGVMVSGSQGNAPQEQETRKRYEENIMSLDEIMDAYRNKVAEMDAALSALTPPPDYTPEQQRDYYSARKIATIHTEYDMSGYRSSMWQCNLCGAIHNCPSECTRPELGGTWIYVTPEQYIEERGSSIINKQTLDIE